MTTGRGVQLELRLRKADEVRARYYPNGAAGGLTLDGKPPAPMGTPCELVVWIAEPQERHFDLRGRIAWVRHRSSTSLKASFGVDLLDASDAARVRLLHYAQGTLSPEQARLNRRVAARLLVTVTSAGRERKEMTADLSLRGAFVETSEPFLPGCDVVMEIRPPGAWRKLKLNARVAWARPDGLAPGMGLQFLSVDARMAERLRALLDALPSSDDG